ncbi:unnamed protein product [Coccothraustes coccothraustes]
MEEAGTGRERSAATPAAGGAEGQGGAERKWEPEPRPPLWGSGAQSKGGKRRCVRPAGSFQREPDRRRRRRQQRAQAAAATIRRRRRWGGGGGGGERAAPACGITRGPGGAERGDRGSP